MKHRDGFTIIEMLLTAALLGLVVLVVAQLGFPLFKFIQRSQSRQEAQAQARICLETVERAMSNGRASTVTISNSPSTPPMQSGQVQFQAVDGSSYTITWSTAPPNSVHLQHTPLGSSLTTDTVLATSVTEFSFGWNPGDPSIINVNFVMSVPLDSSGSPDSVMTLMLPPQTIQMNGS
jgi:prepilin-type N-terminal cleavage/methylation domain-containing protein